LITAGPHKHQTVATLIPKRQEINQNSHAVSIPALPFYYRHADQSCIDGEVTEEVSRTSVDDVATIATKLSQIDNLSFEVTADWTGPVPDSGDLSELNGSKNVDANETPVGPTPQRRRRAVLPTNFDARTEATCGTLAGITRNQGGCGSCYAFSLAKTVTHSLCKATNGGSQKMLSTMDFLNCYEPLYGDKNDACRGGYTMRGLTHFKQNGVVTGTDVNDQYGHGLGCYPYGMGGNALAHFDFTKPMKPTCPTACHGDYSTPSFSADKSGGAATIEIVYLNDDQSIMEHIYEHGAVSATYTVYEDFFAYRSGVYTKNSNVRKGGHAVAVIGWGVENGMPYWLCQNSWGPNWGWGGLFKIRRGTNEADFGARAFGGVKWNCPAGQSVSSDGKCVQGVCSDTMYSEGGVCKPCPFGGKSNAARTGCELRSVNSNTFVRIKMINNSGKTATFRWIDYDGKNHGTGPVIASGSSFTTGTTYMTHPWLIIVDGVEIFAAAPPAGSDPDVTLVLTRELKAAYVNGQVGSCKSSSSQQGLGTVTLQFVNGVNQHVEVYWISTNGSLHKYADLSPGQHYDQGTFVKHQWAAKIKNGDWIWYGTATVEDFLKYNKRVRVNLLSNKQAVKSTF